MLNDVIKVSRSENVKVISLNNPKTKNAFNVSMLERFYEELKKESEKKTPPILLIKGEDRVFSSGIDVFEVGQLNDKEKEKLLALMQKISEYIIHYQNFTISFIEKFAIGMAAEIAMNTDFIFLEKEGYFAFPELDHGFSLTQGSSFFLKQYFNYSEILDLIFIKKRISDVELKKRNIVYSVNEHSLLQNEVDLFIQQLSVYQPEQVALFKGLFRSGDRGSIHSSLQEELQLCQKLIEKGM